jgi:hypothetical protein
MELNEILSQLVCYNISVQSLTCADSRRKSVVERKLRRFDANLGYQNIAYDIDRVALQYSSGYFCFFASKEHVSLHRMTIHFTLHLSKEGFA